jgi:hypothetical protein
MAKYGMSMCTLGHAGEFRGYGIAVNSLWPRTAIATAALQMIPGVDTDKCRKPEILSDAAYLILTSDARETTGNFFVDDELLARHGITDLEKYSVVPDIVVLGKPIGNGHPIGAVITTRAIADSFNNGMEFFSTFGGNNVSCAIGLKVLEVVHEENLQAHAQNVGAHLLARLHDLHPRHEVIREIRGSGFFLGVELTENASAVVNRAPAEVRHGPVRARPRNTHAPTRHALVRDDDREHRRLPDHARVDGPVALDQLPRPREGELLVGGRREDYGARALAPPGVTDDGGHHRGD